MAPSNTPNLDFGSPMVFFDSHPEEQDSYLYSYWSGLKSQLKTAWTGDVPKFHEPGKLRIIFWTQDNQQGIKDYELHEFYDVREAWEKLLNVEEVRRAIVMGYSGQNPYISIDGGSNPWAEKFTKQKMDSKKEEERRREADQKMSESREGRRGEVLDIQAVIARADEAGEKKNAEREDNISERDRLLDV